MLARQARGDGGAGAGARRRVARLGAQEREERELAQAIQASLQADARPAPAPAAAAARPMALPKRQSRAPMREDFVDITKPGLSLASPKGGMSAAAFKSTKADAGSAPAPVTPPTAALAAFCSDRA